MILRIKTLSVNETNNSGSAEEYLKPLRELTAEGEDKLLINGNYYCIYVVTIIY